MKQLIQSQRTWVSHGKTWVSLDILGSAMKHLGQPQDTWLSLKVLSSAMEHLGHPSGIWISIKTLGQPQGIWLSHEMLGSTSRYLGLLTLGSADIWVVKN
jgi:DMSO reductase anchor subunit